MHTERGHARIAERTDQVEAKIRLYPFEDGSEGWTHLLNIGNVKIFFLQPLLRIDSFETDVSLVVNERFLRQVDNYL